MGKEEAGIVLREIDSSTSLKSMIHGDGREHNPEETEALKEINNLLNDSCVHNDVLKMMECFLAEKFSDLRGGEITGVGFQFSSISEWFRASRSRVDKEIFVIAEGDGQYSYKLSLGRFLESHSYVAITDSRAFDPVAMLNILNADSLDEESWFLWRKRIIPSKEKTKDDRGFKFRVDTYGITAAAIGGDEITAVREELGEIAELTSKHP